MESILKWGVSCLAQSYQEVRDLYKNGRTLYFHGDLGSKLVKIVPVQDSVDMLQVHFQTFRSYLFLFRDYTFTIEPQGNDRVVVQLVPAVKNPVSLTQVFVQESLRRIVKAVAVVAMTVLTFPIWVPTLLVLREPVKNQLTLSWTLGAERARVANAQFNLVMPPEPPDSHFTPEDILRIGSTLIGYRHVSTEEHAQDNARKGFQHGCSLNLSFCKSESQWNQAKFKDLDLRVQRGEDCDALIREYEAAITDFIRGSIYMDHEGPALTYGDLFATLDQTRFMIVKTGWLNAADVDGYGGLGRLPKENVGPQGVTLLRRIRKEELGLSFEHNRRFSCPAEHQALANYIASHYRRELLRYLREDLDPSQFQHVVNRERLLAMCQQRAAV